MKILKKKIMTKRRIVLLVCLLIIFFYAVSRAIQGKPIFFVKSRSSVTTPLIEEFKQRTKGYFYGQRILENVADFKKCTEGQYCIELENKDVNWFGITHNGYAISLNNKDLTVKLSFKNEGKQAGISFVGKFPAEGREWWNDRIGLNLFAEYDYLKIYLETGDSKDQIELMSQKVPAESNGFHSIYLIFKDSGKTVKILSPQGTTIKELDLPKIYPPTLSQGLFPDKKFYLGLSLAPGSKLTISEFFGFTF